MLCAWFLDISSKIVHCVLTGLSINILHVGDKSLVQRGSNIVWLHCMLMCSHANVPCVPACSCANVSCILTCERANVSYMLMCSHANVHCVLTGLSINILHVGDKSLVQRGSNIVWVTYCLS